MHILTRSMLATAALLLLGAPAAAQSLWQVRDPDKAFLFFDTQARRVGDLVTIVINEDTSVDNQDQRSMNKETNANAGADLDFSSTGIFGSSAGTLNTDNNVDSTREFDGNATFSSAREFSDRITVPVIDVLPNGNLVIGGRRRVKVQNDLRTLVVSGVVRKWDISPDNTVPSRYVSQFDIHYEGKGAESRFVNQGWLGRVANCLWPF